MKTRCTVGITADNAHTEYPCPLLVRDEWLCRNGTWEYAIVGEEKEWRGVRVRTATRDDAIRIHVRADNTEVAKYSIAGVSCL